MKALITGINGFAGGYLAEHLLAQGVEVNGIVRPTGTRSHIQALPHLTFYRLDLMDAPSVASVIQEAQPDLIFHLAALSSVSEAWEDPGTTLTNNIMIQVNLLQAVVAAHINPKILIVGSDEEYGMVHPEEMPIKENQPFRPTNPYGVSKISQDMLGYQYFCSHHLQCVRVRPFNHIGPRQRGTFVVASLAQQVAEAEAGLRPPILEVGNLEAGRDFSDVRDIVNAYYLALEQGEPGEVYNLGSGRMTTVQSILDFYLAQAHIPLAVRQDPQRLRPLDVPARVCDYSKFKALTGWKPAISLGQTLKDVLDYWRDKTPNKSYPEEKE
ncbi:MAG: GDP-mannose 4,6-dehydratase [Chloroflexi bacterium]|nr:GDP-mannose 4,6-dehydratase [Chloroflexota bacterium]